VPAHRDRHLNGTADQHGTPIVVDFADDRDVDISEVAARSCDQEQNTLNATRTKAVQQYADRGSGPPQTQGNRLT